LQAEELVGNVVIFVGVSISVVVYVCYRTAFNRESVESDLALLCVSMLPHWFKKNRASCLTNQTQKLKSIMTLPGDFPALCAGYVYLSRFLIGCLCWLRLL